MDLKIILVGVVLTLSPVGNVYARVRRAADENATGKTESQIPKVQKMKYETTIANRFAKTLISRTVKNVGNTSQEAIFSVPIPPEAFISGFSMEVNGSWYHSNVKEKREAENIYNETLGKGTAVAQVESNPLDSNLFKVFMNVEPDTEATFLLTYEELLPRHDNKYELSLNIQPGELLDDLEVLVKIAESRPLTFTKILPLQENEATPGNSGIDPGAEVKTTGEFSVEISFKPDIAKQKSLISGLGGNEEEGLKTHFVVQYDVVRDPQGGEILLDGDFFVHFIPPEDLVPIKKQVVFVVDNSGSMSGPVFSQVKEALNIILDELDPEDTFNFVEFSSAASVWNVESGKLTYRQGEPKSFNYFEHPGEPAGVIAPALVASKENVIKAKEVVSKLESFGNTDILTALKVGFKVADETKTEQNKHTIIILLTDGDQTLGITNLEYITSEATNFNTNKIPIFSLSFGAEGDRYFLRDLSLKNQGFSRHVFDFSQVSRYVKNFYKQISSPLLQNATFKYLDKVDPILHGSYGYPLELRSVTHTAIYRPGLFGHRKTNTKSYGSLERLSAYLKLKELLLTHDAAEDTSKLTQEAVKLALKYSLVTDVTSLVIVKPTRLSGDWWIYGPAGPPHEVPEQPSAIGLVVRGGGFEPQRIQSATSITEKEPPKTEPEMDLSMEHSIENNYVETKISARVKNPTSEPKVLNFPFVLPERGLVTGAMMDMNEKRFGADIKLNAEADRIYNEAVANGTEAVTIKLKEGTTNTVIVTIFLEPNSEALVHVRYEETLVRKNGIYEFKTLVLHEQIDKSLKFGMDAGIHSQRPIKFFQTKFENEAHNSDINPTLAVMLFKADAVKEIVKRSPNGEEFVIQFDMESDPFENEILVDDGCFVQVFKPLDLPQVNKQIVFVLNVAGKVSDKVKAALKYVLDQLLPSDQFSIVQSSSATSPTNEQFLAASQENIENAQNAIDSITSSKNGNVASALESAFGTISKNKDSSYKQAVIYVTDIDETTPAVNSESITKITEGNKENIPLFSIVHGTVKQAAELQRLCLQNKGYLWRIFDVIDIKDQFADYYQQLSKALALNTNFKELHDILDPDVPHYFPLHVKDSTIPAKYDKYLYERHWVYLAGEKHILGNTVVGAQVPLNDSVRLQYGYVTDTTSLVMFRF